MWINHLKISYWPQKTHNTHTNVFSKCMMGIWAVLNLHCKTSGITVNHNHLRIGNHHCFTFYSAFMSSRGNSNIWRLTYLVNQCGMYHSRPWCFQMSPVFCLGLFICQKYLVSFQSQLIKLHFLFLRSSQLCRTEQFLPEAHWLLIVMVPFLSSLGEKVNWLSQPAFMFSSRCLEKLNPSFICAFISF